MEGKKELEVAQVVHACDAELFERVWERLGAGKREGCPVEVKNKTDAQPVKNSEGQITEEEMKWEKARDDFPAEDDLPCFGRKSSGNAGQLQKYIAEELDGWQLCRTLARRVNGPHARSMAALAAEKYRRARKLAAAHFLIAGVRYWPVEETAVPRVTSWLGTLREMFAQEQRAQHRYHAAACDTEDVCLGTLYHELAVGCAAHAALIRNILESVL